MGVYKKLQNKWEDAISPNSSLEIVSKTKLVQMPGTRPNDYDISVNLVINGTKTDITSQCKFVPEIWGDAEGEQILTAQYKSLSASISVMVKKAIVYGVKVKQVDKDSYNAVEYIDDATGFTPMTRHSPGTWKNNPLISGIKPVLRKSDGTWQDLDKRNLANGADIENTSYDVLTEIPTWYLSLTSDSNYGYVRFSPVKIDSTYYDLASYYKGRRVGMFHIGCFLGSDVGSTTHSVYNKLPTVTYFTERHDNAQRRANFDIMVTHQLTYIQALFLLLFKGRNSSNLLGLGTLGGDGGRTVIEYDNDYGMAGNETDSPVAFFWINHLWGGPIWYIGGAKVDANYNLYVQTNGELSEPLLEDFSNMEYIGPILRNNGMISRMDMSSTKKGFIASEVYSSSSQFDSVSSCFGFTRSWCSYWSVSSNHLFMSEGSDPYGKIFAIRGVRRSDSTYGSYIVYRAGRT